MLNVLKKLLISLLIMFVSMPLLLTPVLAEGDSVENSQETDTTESEEPVNPSNTNGEYWIFHSESCPHCKKVVQFVENQNLTDKVVLKELPASQAETDQTLWDNQTQFIEIIQELGLDGGIPLIVKDGSYVSGDTPIINYLTSEFSLSEEVTAEPKGISPLLIGILSLVGIIVILFVLLKVVST
ncbi:hypothetical protein JW962_00750 [Candidatus Dojkabacteria bacterium]|nr:hypothetical protein [Candidatus Dojkabacteria bacterium]